MAKTQTVKNTKHDPSRRKERGLLAIGINLPKIAAPAMRKRGFTHARLVTDWPAIVGEKLGNQTAPQKIVFPRGSQNGALLYIRVAQGFALELQHIAPQVIDRINVFFGYRAVSDLRYLQAPIMPHKRRRRVMARYLSDLEEARLQHDLQKIKDPGLKGSFTTLGRAIRSKSRYDKESA
ncbi:MAG: DciA family protein [Pseudomonadota bacterium]|nr:DciA family protein [Pseudomonadota bacterium]